MKIQSKYYNIKTRAADGKIFDSYREASRYDKLLLLLKAGHISDLQTQVKYELIPAQYETVERYSKKGERLKDRKKLVERKVEYIADFVYTDTATGETIVEDTKGVRTKDYIIKRKLMLAIHGIHIKEF